MNKEKHNIIINLFNNKEIRSVWDSEKEDYYFSVVDVISALTDSSNPRDYWYRLKQRLSLEEKSELSTKCRQLKLPSKDGKKYLTDTLATENIFRLIESVPSPKAEPFKIWLARLGKERINEIFDPEIAINRAIEYYLKHGYDDKWIKIRLISTIDRKRLTNDWKNSGINNDFEYAILTNEIYKAWSGMSAKEYKSHKNIRKENLRDNMTDIEVSLTNLGEVETRELNKKYNPYGFNASKKIESAGGGVAKAARTDLENKLGKSVVTKDNVLKYEYFIEDTNKK